MSIQINRELARRVLEVVDAGLVHDLGSPEPGHMCVEAAVCYALGLPHSDDPKCVSGALRSLKIALNDKPWSSPQARAKGLRRLAIAQLGSAGVLDEKAFLLHVAEMTIRKIVPMALRSAITLQTQDKHKEAMETAAKRCETEGTKAAADAAAACWAADADTAANAAYWAASAADVATAACWAAAAASWAADAASAAAANAAYAAAADAVDAERDRVLAFFAEEVVQILIAMKAPGTEWLDLTETVSGEYVATVPITFNVPS